jgi:hypothetical protein
MYGAAVYALAVGVFIWVVRQTEPAPPSFGYATSPTFGPPRLTFWFTSLMLVALVAQNVNTPGKTPGSNLWLLGAWVVGLGLFGVNVLRASGWSAPTRAGLGRWWQAHRVDVALMVALGGLAFVVRVYDLEFHPYSFINDEGEAGREAWRIVTGQRTNLFEVGWAGQPIMSFTPTALAVYLLGHTVFAVRVVSALAGALTVSVLFLLGREIFDRATGLLAAGLLLTLPFHVHFSRLGVSNGMDALTSTLTLWLTLRAIRRGSLIAYGLAGLAAGLSLYTYLGSRLSLALAIGTVLYAGLSLRGYLRAHGLPVAIFFGAIVMTALPMAVFFQAHPDQFMARINAEGIIQNGHLAREAANGHPALTVLLNQFRASSLVYIARPALAGFFSSPAPYLTSLAASVFVLGLGYAFWRIADLRYLTLLAWFWAVVVLGGTLTNGAPASQRLLMSAPVLALFFALGLIKMLRALSASAPRTAKWAVVSGCVIMGVLSVQQLDFYFREYRQGHYFEVRGNEISYEFQYYLPASGYRLYLIGDPVVYAVFANFDFLAPQLEKHDFNQVTADTLAAVPRDQGAFFIAIPERRAELEQVARHWPNGEWLDVPRRYQSTEILFYAYHVPAQP